MAKEKAEEGNDETLETEETLQDKKPEEDAKRNYEEMREQMLRIAAEFDNYKKRVRKDVESAAKLGKASLVKSMLPILDEFELAIIAINESKDRDLAKGIEMVYSNLIGMLKKEGMEEIDANGAFDPYKHEIVLAKESDDDDGMILEVVKKGYMFDGIMIRPASVIVAKHDEKTIDNIEK